MVPFLFVQTPSTIPSIHSYIPRTSSVIRLTPICEERKKEDRMPHTVERSRSLHSALKKNDITAAEKKVVQFADTLGLDLVQVRCVFPHTTSDEDILQSPSIIIRPKGFTRQSSTTRVVHSGSFNDARFLQLHAPVYPLSKDYSQVNKELVQRAKTNGVCLKSSSVIGMTFSATVSVFNYGYQKKVYVRYTLDRWRTHTEIQARYVSSSPQENLDNFSFSLFLPHSIPVGAKCEFAIRFQCGGRELWDNNQGRNYVIECRTMAETFNNWREGSHERPSFY